MLENYTKLMALLKTQHPDIYQRVEDSELGGCTGSEIRGMIQLELRRIKKEEVSSDLYSLIQKAIDELYYQRSAS